MARIKLISWNVNGLRSIYRKDLEGLFGRENPSLLCLQETKIAEVDLCQLPKPPVGYDAFFSSAKRKGYAGVCTYVSSLIPHRENKLRTGIGAPAHDDEGRFLITDHRDFIVCNTYFPSGTTGEVRQKVKYKFLDEFLDFLSNLSRAQRKKLIICGDFNICHREIDIHHPKIATQRELSGFLPDERAWMDRLVSAGFVDTFRHLNGDKLQQFSWWTFRAGARKKNLGWRIDYVFVAKELAGAIKKAQIHGAVMGSDHCPVSVEFSL